MYLSKVNMDMESEEEKGLGMAYSVGEVQGWRRGMEDAHISILDLKSSAKKLLGAIDEKENISMFGVFDGHGGKEVAKFVQIKFIREFIKSKSFQEQQYR